MINYRKFLLHSFAMLYYFICDFSVADFKSIALDMMS